MKQKREDLLLSVQVLERRLFETKAQLACALSAAFDNMPAANNYKGSGIIVTIQALGGKQVVAPFMVRDGFSSDTVRAIQVDICRSFEIATMANPAMALTLGVSK